MKALLFNSQLACQNFEKPAIPKTFISILLFISSLIVYLIRISQYYNKRNPLEPRLPPGPRPWPLFGSCLPLMLSSYKRSPRHQWIHTVMKQLNTEIACFHLGSNTHIIIVTSPELALEFLKTHDSIFASRPIASTTEILSCGFLSTVLSPMGDQWKKMKRILASHVLNPSTLHQMRGQRIKEADALLHYIFDHASRCEAINIRSITQHYCSNIIRRMVFNRRYYKKGRENEGPSLEEEDYNQALLTILMNLYSFSISEYIACLKPFDLGGHQKIIRKALKVITNHDGPIIEERVQEWRDGKKKEVQDILDILITVKKDQNGESLLSIEEIKAQVTELQLATIDNPSNAVEWAMIELLNQPKILQKAVEELDEVVGRDRLVQEFDIPNLKYLTACMRESFRLHPFSPFNLPHVSISDIVVGGYFIPKGSQILLCRVGLGRNPRIWEDPMRFDPERHLRDQTVKFGLSEPSLRFITFTRGRRGCIGSSLGTNITMMLFARLLQGFSWSLLSGFSVLPRLKYLSNQMHSRFGSWRKFI
ncbi:tryptophan N-monooxygenase CYP79A68-like isoform X2 [Cucumis melo]|uniref:Tryptophan N-monooxygenase CYP79A68-like isoform X2 n=1 Tax=Cucumis melo TaxID=3656 RepID=A0A1S3BNA6_CUCME|nr:tryptophan N-monooxygenase CYP79A68-like isoform X2 [Cucumis melo]